MPSGTVPPLRLALKHDVVVVVDRRRIAEQDAERSTAGRGVARAYDARQHAGAVAPHALAGIAQRVLTDKRRMATVVNGGRAEIEEYGADPRSRVRHFGQLGHRARALRPDAVRREVARRRGRGGHRPVEGRLSAVVESAGRAEERLKNTGGIVRAGRRVATDGDFLHGIAHARFRKQPAGIEVAEALLKCRLAGIIQIDSYVGVSKSAVVQCGARCSLAFESDFGQRTAAFGPETARSVVDPGDKCHLVEVVQDGRVKAVVIERGARCCVAGQGDGAHVHRM